MPKHRVIQLVVDKDFHVWEACSKEDSRPVLTGVYVDPKGYLVAADGFILAVVPCALEGSTRSFPGCIVPAVALKEASKLRTATSTYVELDLTDGVAQGRNGGGAMVRYPFITGTFPNWRQLIPQRGDMGPHKWYGLNPQYSLRLTKALGVDFGKALLSKGGGPLLFVGPGGSFGLQMPMYCLEPDARMLREIFALRGKPGQNGVNP